MSDQICQAKREDIGLTLTPGQTVKVQHSVGSQQVYVWQNGNTLRVSIIGPVYPILDVTPTKVVEVEEDTE